MKTDFQACEKCSKCIRRGKECEGYELSVRYETFYCPNYKEKK